MSYNEEKIEIGKITDLFKNAEDDGTFETSLYELYVLIEITKGVSCIGDGNGISLEELDMEMRERHARYSRRFC